jgi:hypothetical protein
MSDRVTAIGDLFMLDSDRVLLGCVSVVIDPNERANGGY